MKHYVLGFAFSHAFNQYEKRLVLIRKNRPEWQAGKMNGIGGKIEEEDFKWNFNHEATPMVVKYAMTREFKEETGVESTSDQWDYFGKMIFNKDIMGGGATVHLLRSFLIPIDDCKTNEDEEIIIDKVKSYLSGYSYPLMHNLPILIPLALSTEFNFTELSD
jgi:8-oxo-dGTP pyrophosphatase MutT (NUDIX family)